MSSPQESDAPTAGFTHAQSLVFVNAVAVANFVVRLALFAHDALFAAWFADTITDAARVAVVYTVYEEARDEGGNGCLWPLR